MIALMAALALGAEVEATSQIEAVTVYASQARVTRKASVQLQKGRQVVLFPGLPIAAQTSGMVADVSAGAELAGVDARRVTAREVADERVAEIDEKLLELRDKRAELTEERSTHEATLISLRQSLTEAAKALSAQLLVADRAAERTRAMHTQLAAEEKTAREQMLRLAHATADLDKEIAALQRERNGLGSSATDTWTAQVHLEVARAGRYNVDVSYLISGANWEPRYDIRGDVGGGVQLSLSALVSQRTGEDWGDVELTVSSAQPSRGTDTPMLDPYWLQPRRVAAKRSPRSRSTGGAPSMAAAAPAPMMEEMADYDDYVEMEVATAVVDVQLSATAFSVERPESVPADGGQRKVLLTTEDLEADLFHVVVPRLDRDAFLVGEVTNSASFPLLPGEAGVFMEGAYVGDLQLPSVPPGDTFDVAFGADDRVEVERKPKNIDTGDQNLGGKKSKARWEWQIVATNRHKAAVDLRVREQVPMTSREDIDVKRLNGSGEPESEQDEQGRIEFTVPLGSGQKKTFVWGYEVEYPSELRLGWME